MDARMITIIYLLTASPVALCFVITTPSTILHRQHHQVANTLSPPLYSDALLSTKNDLSILFSQQSSEISIECTNQTDGGILSGGISSDDDMVAMMTSRALEDEEHPLFVSFAPPLLSDDHESSHIAASINIDEKPFDQSDPINSIPCIESRNEEPMIQQNTMEPHIFHFNKIMIDTVYNMICMMYPTTTPKSETIPTSTNAATAGISPTCFARFYVLETVARVPYFAYLSVLHLRETLGDRTYSGSHPATMSSDVSDDINNSSNNNSRIRTHYAEADNELHHLLIMESLGGNTNPIDRAIAQCMAVGYYWYVVFVYSMISPQAAYHLSELIEDHAYHTYDDFLKTYEPELKQLPVPSIAKQYYMDDNSFLQDLCRTVKDPTTSNDNNISRPKPILNSLYDVFVCVRDDEKEHWKTLCHLVQYDHMNAITTTTTTTTTLVNDDDITGTTVTTTTTLPTQSTQPSVEVTKKSVIQLPWWSM